jgi:hypothetical protein
MKLNWVVGRDFKGERCGLFHGTSLNHVTVLGNEHELRHWNNRLDLYKQRAQCFRFPGCRSLIWSPPPTAGFHGDGSQQATTVTMQNVTTPSTKPDRTDSENEKFAAHYMSGQFHGVMNKSVSVRSRNQPRFSGRETLLILLSLAGSYVIVHNYIKSRIWGCHTGSYEEYTLMGCKCRRMHIGYWWESQKERDD